ncbi:hypothetical protein [Lichenibacterium dinghuense]|uniref:hypothetical protein n=1 Tax=Lichenibacterium dinghuense TaxID=2895977 RepID=UPI001F46FA65|nr:hypothetical protein [Lichenibacterium sp. 6Y81]
MRSRPRLLSTASLSCLLLALGAGQVRADASTSAEIALLKAQLRRLEAKVAAQERRDHARDRAEAAPAAAGPGPAATRKQVVQGTPVNAAHPAARAVGDQVYGDGPLPQFVACPEKSLCYKGLTFTPGGFVALETVSRQHNLAADVDTPFGAIPFRQNRAGRLGEFRFSARQSRISGLVEGNPDPFTHLSAYGEFDFLGAAQTANSNESNSYNLRIRHLYATADRSDYGLHFLAGQTWSLATMFTKGLQVRKEDIPLTIDAQYVPGFVWSRQPQVRLVEDISPILSVGVSAENPQTTENGTLPSSFTYNQAATGGGLFNSLNSLSLNHAPDLVAKVAYDPTIDGHDVHVEAFGIGRDFYSRYGGQNRDVIGGGGGGSVVVGAVPKVLDLQLSGAIGEGLGRYGTAQLPDITVSSTGRAEPLAEFMLLAGATFHATPTLDFYAYAGLEQDDRSALGTVGGVNYGYGNPLNSNAGCNIEGSTATCTANNRTVRQVTGGLWDTIYSGPFGQLRGGLQASFTQRQAFSSVQGGAPHADEAEVLTSIRYYPF